MRGLATKWFPFHAPDERTIPEGPVGDAIRYEKKVLTETHGRARGRLPRGAHRTGDTCDRECKTDGLVNLRLGSPVRRARRRPVSGLEGIPKA